MERLLDFLTDPMVLAVACCAAAVAVYCLSERARKRSASDMTAMHDAEARAAEARAAETRAKAEAVAIAADAARAAAADARAAVEAGSARSSMGGAGLMWHEPSAADWTGGEEEERLWRLEKMLKSSGETYEELAPKLGCTTRALFKVRKGKAAVSDKMARALYEHFGADAYSVAAFGMTPEEYRAARR